MRSTAVVLASIMAVCGAATLVRAQAPHPFRGQSDTGETVPILPAPAAVRSARGTGATFAAPSRQTQVNPPSYGSGPLLSHGGPVIGNAGFWAIYWNSSVANASQTTAPYTTLKTQLDAFVTSFGSNPPYSAASTDDYAIVQQYGSAITSTVNNWGYYISTQATKGSVSDSSIRSFLTSLFNAGKVQAAGNIIYGVYLPAGMRVTLNGGGSCSTFCGYHGSFAYGGVKIRYAVFPYLNCSACSISGLTVADMMTIVMSHEIREAVTDPDLNAWYDASGYEADDKCAWHNLYRTTNGSFWVQPEYSNGGGTMPGASGAYPGPGCVVPNR